MPLQEVVNLLRAAIEASVYVSPTEPGLTFAELNEIGNRLGLKEGEIGDALPQVGQYFGVGNRRLILPEQHWHSPGFLVFREEPDLRNPVAFDFVVAQLNELTKEVGSVRARLDRSIMLDRAQAQSVSRHDVEVAITLMLLSGQLTEDDGALRYKSTQGGERQLPSVARNQPGFGLNRIPKTDRTRVMPHVRDVVERRADGRPKSAEPFGAFAEQLEKLGYAHFRLWWSQTVAELGRTDSNSSPLSALVLAAALVEGALTFVVKHAQTRGLATLASTDFTRDPKTWKVEDLLNSAARGGADAILDSQAKTRAEGLINTRQRIHAGRMLSEFPSGVPDLRPEEAREAKGVAEQVVRRVIDWLEKYPPP